MSLKPLRRRRDSRANEHSERSWGEKLGSRAAPVRARARLVTREGWQGETPALSTMSR